MKNFKLNLSANIPIIQKDTSEVVKFVMVILSPIGILHISNTVYKNQP